MGQMRFHAPSPDQLLPQAVEHAYLAGMEAIPWRCSNSWSDGVLSICRAVSDSGNLYIPWDVPGHGHRMLSTCTLVERAQPYCLITELARGCVNQARNLIAEQESIGWSVAPEIADRCHAASSAFIGAVTGAADRRSGALAAIGLAQDVTSAVCRSWGPRLIAVSNEAGERTPTLLATQVEPEPLAEPIMQSLRAAFHAVSVPLRWRHLEPSPGRIDLVSATAEIDRWRRAGMRILGGPLIQMDPLSLPEWVSAWRNDYTAFEEAATRYVQAIAESLDPLVDIWVCAGRLNLAGTLDFTEEQRLRLSVALIEAIRQVAPRTPLIVSFDQPWAEYLAREDQDLSPLHFADALVRAELGVAGVGLELNLGYWPHGTLPRDLLAISHQLDRWSLLGIPLVAFLTMPSGVGHDPQVVGDRRVIPDTANGLAPAAMDQGHAEHLVPLLLSKSAVKAVVWNQFSDAHPHAFPHGGLLDTDGQPKPILSLLTSLRRQFLA